MAKMLVIREAQVKVFEKAALLAFEDEMVRHCRKFAPRLCAGLPDGVLRGAARRAVAGAARFGFTNRGPVRLFIEMALIFGGGFPTDPQYPWVAETLDHSGDQMKRANRLWLKTLDYQREVFGPGAGRARRVVADLLNLVQPPDFAVDDHPGKLLAELTRLHPEKMARAGAEGGRRLIQEGAAAARQLGLPPGKGTSLLTLLMFAFGHGFTEDPLHPWVGDARDGRENASADEIFVRFQQKAVVALKTMLATLA